MTRKEFETRTGCYPIDETYKIIEEEYYRFGGDKDAFCKAFKENTDGLAQRIQGKANSSLWMMRQDYADRITQLEARISRLSKELEREQEWRFYEMDGNVGQECYNSLRSDESTQFMTDQEAKDLLYDWYGFAREKVTILHSVPVYEANRHRQLRKVGEAERLPLYNATDWNYIRFDCGAMSYELFNDQIRIFEH